MKYTTLQKSVEQFFRCSFEGIQSVASTAVASDGHVWGKGKVLYSYRNLDGSFATNLFAQNQTNLYSCTIG